MSDLTALLAAVIAAPEDDAPRAAYAAAIAMTDPERAELISIQLRLDASRKAQRLAAERGPAAIRAGELVRKRGAEWARDVAPLVAKYQLLRGFVDSVTLDAAAFLARAETIYARAPVLHLTLTHVRAVDMLQLFTSPHLVRLHSLDLHRNDLNDLDLAVLASQQLPNLRWLNVQNNHISRAGIDALASTPSLPRLAYVDLADNAIANPLPGLIDDYAIETPLARELLAQHGKVAWLDLATLRRFREWPPERDTIP